MLIIQFNTWQFILSVVALIAFCFLFVVLFRKHLHRKGASASSRDEKILLEYRTKDPSVDVNQFSGIFFRLGLLIALAVVFFAFSWTTFDRGSLEAIDLDYNTGFIEKEIPITYHQEKPKPKMKEIRVEVLEDDLLIEEDPELISMDAFEDSEIFEDPVVEELPGDEASILPLPETREDAPKLFFIVEENPRFPGCETEGLSIKEKEKCARKHLLSYIYDHLTYPVIARENGVEGTVVIQFVVTEKGSIEEIQIKRDIGAGCGSTAAKVVESMNDLPERWQPGKQRGRPVRVLYTLPVKFQLQG
jgi:protein TonB